MIQQRTEHATSQPSPPKLSPELEAALDKCPGFRRPFEDWKGPEPKPSVYQLSAKLGRQNKFEDQVKHHLNLTLQSDVIDPGKIFEYYELPDFIISDPVFGNHTKFVTLPKDNSKTGGGYWFWKPTLMNHHLQNINEGDFLIYCDNDLIHHLRLRAQSLETMVDKGKNVAITRVRYTMSPFTKRDIDEAYCHRTSQEDQIEAFDGMFSVLRKDKATMQFAYQFAEGAKDFHAISDEPSRLPNFKFNRAHRRDQGIQNGIMNCRYGAPSRERFWAERDCSFRVIETFNLPVWDDSKLISFMNETENAFRIQEKLHRNASEAARNDPDDPYWRSYLQTSVAKNETYWKLYFQFNKTT